MITSQVSNVVYAPNGVTTVFAIPFPFLVNSEVDIFLTVDGARSEVTTGITLAGAGNPSGGSVTFSVAPTGSSLLIERNTVPKQEVDYVNNDAFEASSNETQLDRLAMAVIDKARVANESLERTFRVPAGETLTQLMSAAMRLGMLPYFNATTGDVELKSPNEILALSDGAPTGIGLPAGGNIGEYFYKRSAADYDAGWRSNFVDVRDYGLIADGTSHPVSEWLVGGDHDRGYADLAAIQAVIPQVSSLSDEIDWAAVQAALNSAYVNGIGSIVQMPIGDQMWNRNVIIKGDGMTLRGAGRKATWIEMTDNAAGGIKFTSGLAGTYQTHLQDFTIRAKTTGVNTGIGVDTRNAGVEGFWMILLSANRVDILGFDTCWLASNLPGFTLTDCIFVGVTYGIDFAKCDTFNIQSCYGGGAGPDKAPGSELNLPTCTVFRIRNNTTGVPVSPNFAGVIEMGEYGNCAHFIDMQSGNVDVRNCNTETFNGAWTIRNAGGNIRVLGNRFANNSALSSHAIAMQTAAGAKLTFRNNKIESLACPVVYQGDDYFYSSFDVDTRIEWKSAAGVLAYSATSGNFEPKNQDFWNSIYAAANYTGVVLRKPRNATVAEDLIYSWVDGAGLDRSTSLINDKLAKVLAVDVTQRASVAGAATITTLAMPAGTLLASGNEVVFEAYGQFAANGNNKQIQIGSVGFNFDSGTGTWNNLYWSFTCRAILINASMVHHITTLNIDGQSPITKLVRRVMTASDPANFIIYTTTTAASDILVDCSKLTFKA